MVSRRVRSPKPHLTSVSLFTGCGGLDIGLEEAGFSVRLCVEREESCRQTLRACRPRWPQSHNGDIFSVTANELRREAGIRRKGLHLLAGGPPCQPFSKAGFWHAGDARRLNDPRADTIESFFASVDEFLPRVVLLENVAGFAYEDKDEAWRLCCSYFKRINRQHGTSYSPQLLRINAADYGVPQLRNRVFVIAERKGLHFLPPPPTHAPLEKASELGLSPYLTSWDAIGDLTADGHNDDLSIRGKWARLVPTIPEGKNYLFHSPGGGGEPLFGWRTRYWSFLLKLCKSAPAWTLVASPGPSTGPFHWQNRLLTRRELCRLQTFPDDFEVVGDYNAARRQIGNAVPPLIGEFLGLEIRRQFFGHRVRRSLRLAIHPRPGTPAPDAVLEVPQEYYRYRADHGAHPGPGRGPGAIRRSNRQLTLNVELTSVSASSQVEE